MADPANRCRVFWLQVTLLIVCLVSCTPSTIRETPTVTGLPIATELPSEPNQIRQRILLPQGAGAVAFGNGSIWVVNPTEHHVLRIDVEIGEQMGTPIPLDFEPGRIAYGEGAAWVVSADHARVARIDPQTNEVIAEIDLRSLEIPDHVLLLIAAIGIIP